MRAVQALPQDAGLGEDLPGEVGAEPADRLEADTEEAVVVGAGEQIRPGARWTGRRQR